jgi:hypothetical protein
LFDLTGGNKLVLQILGMIRKHKHHTVVPEKIFLYSGEFILFAVLLYLVFATPGTDSVVRIGVPLLLGAIALILTSRHEK